MSESRNNIEKIFTGAAFTFFVLITCYKLTNSALWFDETIEYWYSKIMFGRLPFSSEYGDTVNMYQRIVSTFQPPLYNVIMFFWLKISDAEWWFRFFGVIMGFIGMVGIYKTLEKICGNSLVASLAVVFSSCNYHLSYYWQECAEYCLMLGSLCWTFYFWVCLIRDINRKNIILFTIFAVIPVYSQYGAAFPVLGMCLIAYIIILSKKDMKYIIEISVAYLSALICAALPLYVFFIRKQVLNQQGGTVAWHNFLGSGLIKDFCVGFYTVFRWSLESYYSFEAVCISIFIIMLAALIVLIRGKILAKLLIAVFAVTWMSYYITVKFGLYSYGRFGNRYNVFFIPVWIVLIFTIGYEIYCILQQTEFMKRLNVHLFFLGMTVCLIACYNLLSWEERLRENWDKEGIRDAVDTWYQYEASEKYTIVYYGADSGFSYYVKNSEHYNDQTENNVVYMYWYADKREEDYQNYIDSIYGENWPEEIFIAGSHLSDDFDTLIGVFTNHSYASENIYVTDGTRLVRLQYAP